MSSKKFCTYTGSKFAIACCNTGTSALHISLKLADVVPGDEVITPTITFIATVNSIIYNSYVLYSWIVMNFLISMPKKH